MSIRLLALSAILAAALAAPAAASSCPKHMKAIDDALMSPPQLSAEQLAEVRKLRAEGQAAHEAGMHDKSMDLLGQAEKILGIDKM